MVAGGVADACRIQLVHGGLVGSWDEVAVGVYGDLDAVMPKLVPFLASYYMFGHRFKKDYDCSQGLII